MKAKTAFLSPGQRKALDELEPLVYLSVTGLRKNLPIQPRTHTLLVGPSGSGKSHLASSLAERANVPLWRESVTNWCPMGARGNPSFPALIRWLLSVDGGVVFIDELDKLVGGGEYYGCIRTEIFSLLDMVAPNTAIMVQEVPDPDPFGGKLSAEDRHLVAKVIAEQKLRHHVFLIGAGAWQDCWEECGSRPIGFQPVEAAPRQAVERVALLRSIAPELLQRFRKDILFLPPMSEDDYLQVLREQLPLIPTRRRDIYEEMVRNAIPSAVSEGLGMRVFEEVFSDLCTKVLKQVTYDDFVFGDIMTSRGF